MTEDIDELLCGDDVDSIYGEGWYFEMAKIYLSDGCSSQQIIFAGISSSLAKALKDAA